MLQRIFLLILVGATLMACSSASTPSAAWDTQMGTTSWQLMQLGDTAVADDAVTIELITNDQGKLSFNGQGFCNNYNIQITKNADESVTLAGVASTRRMCPDPQMNNERDYFAALEATTRISIVDGKLLFVAAQGQTLLTFTK